MEKAQLLLLKQFVEICTKKPQTLNRPDLKFFKDWIESLGATVPEDIEEPTNETEAEPKVSSPPPKPKVDEPEEESSSGEEAESDIDIDNEGVIEDNEVPSQDMGPEEEIELTEELEENVDNKRSEAMSAFSEGKFDEAIAAFTEVIKITPTAPMFSKRANSFLKLKRPRAAIKDCDRALELNPDSAPSYKFRGLAYKLLGDWEKSFADLTVSNRIDFSEDTYAAMKEVEGKAKKILEHKRKYARKAEEKEIRQRMRRVKKAREAYERAKQEEPAQTSDYGFSPEDMVNDPDLLEMLKDPEVMQAMNEIMVDQSKMAKYANNPKIRTVLEKMQSKFYGGGFSDLFGGAAAPGGAADECCGGHGGGHGHGGHGHSHGHGDNQPPPSVDDLD
jgi:suppressor of tumorigenicity protein 13